MHVEATTAPPLATDADTIVLGALEGQELADDPSGGELGALLHSGEARAQLGRLALAHHDGRRFLLVGLGPREEFGAEQARVAAAAITGRARELGAVSLCWRLPQDAGGAVAAGLVEGTVLSAYRFLRYKPADERPLERLLISASNDFRGAVAQAAVIAAAQNRARDLANTPANDLPPATLAAYAQELADRHGFNATVLDEAQIRELGMGAFSAVAQGSTQDARLIRLEYNGASQPQQPRLGLVGKAVTFDSGGLSLKSAGSMKDMKFDMAGGAAVIEAIAALAELGAPVRVLGIVGATENLPAAARSSRATSSARSMGPRSRSTTPTPRAGWCSLTASSTPGGKAPRDSSISRP